jgi:hypothetical protein
LNKSLARIVTFNSSEDARCVNRSLPFQRATEVTTKPEPNTGTTISGNPTGTEYGKGVRAGTGFTRVMERLLEVPPPGGPFSTVIGNVPPVDVSDSNTAPRRTVGFTKVVATNRLFHSIRDPGVVLMPGPNPEPVTISSND